MDPPPKRRRLDEPPPHPRDGWLSDASNTGPRSSHSTSVFDGTGISTSHGDFRVGRDVNIFTNHGGHSQPIDTRSALLESLRFDQIDARRLTIKNAYSHTCRWFLETEQYKQWDARGSLRGRHNEFLWIKGKPGAGKSTLMKFLHGHISKQITKNARKEALISFFFNARGQDLEKSIAGLYRSLLLQLLDMKPDLQYVLDSFRPGHEWTIESLTYVLEEAAQGLGESQLVCLIDALDECDQGQVRDMVTFLERLTLDRSSLRICFASRHYPFINIQTDLSTVLEERKGHQEDITTYLNSALRIGRNKRAEKIRSRLQEKACGVFMWVILVVDILNKDYNAGDVLELEDRIEQLPGDLHSLFRDVLTRYTDNRKELRLCFQWILFSKRPLTPSQLYIAILSGSNPKRLSKWNRDDFEEADAERYILDKSKGLTELTKSKIPTVQFMHESVNDFLQKENGLIWLFPDLEANIEGYSHEALKDCCLAYTSIVADQFAVESSKELSRYKAIRAFPLLEYANPGTLYHAEEAGKYGIKQCDFLANFPRLEWVRQRNILEKFQNRWYTLQVSLLYILAGAGHSTLIRSYENRQSCFEIEAERHRIPILAAIARAQRPTVQVMLELEAIRMSSLNFEEFCGRYPPRPDEPSTLDFQFKAGQQILPQLVEHGSDFVSMFFLMSRCAELTEKEKDDLLYLALKFNRPATSKFLINCDSRIPETFSEGMTPLHYASSQGNSELAKLLLDRGSDVLAINKRGETALHLASSVDMAKLLIDYGSNIEAIDGQGRTPLLSMCIKGSIAMATFLIKSGANVLATDKRGNAPLHEAWRDKSALLAMLLVEKGANVSATNENGATPLHEAVCWSTSSSVALAKLLIDSGAKVSATINIGETPLHRACLRNSSAMAKLLIDHGASVSAIDRNERTPLHFACDSGSVGVARILVDNGANVSAITKDGNTPLHNVAQWSRYFPSRMAKFLIDNGASVSARNHKGEIPLHRAVSGNLYGTEAREMVKLLIKNGADVSAVDQNGDTSLHHLGAYSAEVARVLIDHGSNVLATNNDGQTPLHCLARRDHNGTLVKLLIDHGADASIGDHYGNTPLLVASSLGNIAIVHLLLDCDVDVSAANKDGKTPLLAASSGKHYNVVELLRAHIHLGT
ncbi:hypothetical protein PFICI_00241 [Pestalotiopsis fici W106-1]|uniref:Nephrocystin 3-like N-terminal domain-containing protein n=1 Tax=Pestalotiopsis fici (strain W106-1 / CGMCC3.15140) TaxID=1229662 RepID=W3XK45_PESFW|nr:uncharacterized protein PFICI_00241 [Pestalotiopsis fici W106-1]ETS86413.1 hypothetical protein PFICI_00241 [Pestalotiopsis fici W106-1]